MQSDTPSAAESGAATGAPQGNALASEEWILIAAVLKKDRKATAEFVSRYADPVYGYVSQRLAPRSDLVEDLVQEVFLVALQKLDSPTAHPRGPSAVHTIDNRRQPLAGDFVRPHVEAKRIGRR